MEKEANTGCIPWIVRLGGKLVSNKKLVDEQVGYFRQKDPGLPPRVHKLYSLYKAIVHEVLFYLFLNYRVYKKVN